MRVNLRPRILRAEIFRPLRSESLKDRFLPTNVLLERVVKRKEEEALAP